MGLSRCSRFWNDANNARMTLNSSGGPLAGGTITVDGLTIVVPKNLLATLPSIAVAWGELFNNGAANLPGSISWEANVSLRLRSH